MIKVRMRKSISKIALAATFGLALTLTIASCVAARIQPLTEAELSNVKSALCSSGGTVELRGGDCCTDNSTPNNFICCRAKGSNSRMNCSKPENIEYILTNMDGAAVAQQQKSSLTNVGYEKKEEIATVVPEKSSLVDAGDVASGPATIAQQQKSSLTNVGYEKKEEIATVAPEKNSFTDPRDDKTYKTVKIGTQVWFAENLNYKVGNSWCYGNVESNCQKYGRLYDWKTATNACPKDWHLPSNDEWEKLMSARDSWKFKDGTDTYGFSIAQGGSRDTKGKFLHIGMAGFYWSSTEWHTKDAFFWDGSASGFDGEAEWVTTHKASGLSVRCLQEYLGK